MNMEKSKTDNRLLYIIFGSIVIFIYFYLVADISQAHKISNIILYAGSIGVFIMAYFLAALTFRDLTLNSKIGKFAGIALLGGAILWFAKTYSVEPSDICMYNGYYMHGYIRYNIPIGVYMCMLFSAFIIVIIMVKNDATHSILLRVLVGANYIIVATILLYAPNIMADPFGTIAHADAYCNSIINVLHGMPYDIYRTSIYGHYGLFYFLPVSILRSFGMNQWIAITASIAMFGLITFASQIWVFNKLIKSDTLYILAVLANAMVNIQLYTGEYYQVLPHRVLFPSIVLACILKKQYTEGKKQKIMQLLLWILSSLAILWNVECGVICLFVVFLEFIYSKCKNKQKIDFIIICAGIVNAFISIAAAYICVNIYNYISGGIWNSIKTFIYPIASDEYHIEDLWLPLASPFMGHYIVIILFVGILCYHISDILLLTANNKVIFLILTSLMGLGVFTYYMNRVVITNMSIVGFEFVLAMVLLLDWHLPLLKTLREIYIGLQYRSLIYLLGLFIISSMSIATIGSFGRRISDYYNSVYQIDRMHEAVQIFNDVLPEDDSTTAYVGHDLSVITAILDRDSKIYAIDFYDMNPQGIEHIKEELAKKQYEFILTNIVRDDIHMLGEYIIGLNYEEIWTYDYKSVRLFKRIAE